MSKTTKEAADQVKRSWHNLTLELWRTAGTKRYHIVTGIFLLVFLLLVATLWCEDACYPTPDPFPAEGVVVPGTHRIPPKPPETVVQVRAEDGTLGELALQDWRMVVDWQAQPAWWYEQTFMTTYWYLDRFEAYCRFDCDHVPDEEADAFVWICDTDCFAAYADGMVYQHYQSLDCGVTWEVVADVQLAYQPPVRVRRANLRLASKLPPTG